MRKSVLRKYLISLPFLSVISKKKARKKNRISILLLLFWSNQFNQSQFLYFFFFILLIRGSLCHKFSKFLIHESFSKQICEIYHSQKLIFVFRKILLAKICLNKGKKDAVYNGENFFLKVFHWTFSLFVCLKFVLHNDYEYFL